MTAACVKALWVHDGAMKRLGILFLAALFLVSDGYGEWAEVDTISVPVDRVLTNLNRRLVSETNNFELVHALARLHSLSYARAASNWNVNIGTNKTPARDRFTLRAQTNGLPYFGLLSGMPPETVEEAKTSALQAAAKAHLREAIKFYRRATELQSTNEFPWIGLGWCQLRDGQTNEAKASLRRGIKVAWAHEKHSGITFRGRAPSQEAIGYLRPLLDPATDEVELKSLADIEQSAEKLGRAITPLVVPLVTGLAASDLIDTSASIRFDLDGSGVADRRWQWIRTNAAWIVHLPQGGEVNSGLQLFGNVTFWLFWRNGYHALASLDDDGDGVIAGGELNGIALWRDQNSDGRCVAAEILTLDEVGISGFGTEYVSEDGVLKAPAGVRFRNGATGPSYDLVLKQVESRN
jgi:hypothetical protein